MKTIIAFIMGLLLVVAVVVLVVIYVFPWSKDAGKQKIDDVGQLFADTVRAKNVVMEAKKEIEAQMTSLRAKRIEIEQVAAKLQDQEAARDRLVDEKALHEANMVDTIAWLDTHQPKDNIVIDGVTYSYAELEKDADKRARKCEELVVKTQTAERNVQALKSTIADARTIVQDREDLARDRYDELDSVLVKLEAGEAIKQTDSLRASLMGGFADVDESRYFKEIRKRAVEVDAMIAQAGYRSSRSDFIPLEKIRGASGGQVKPVASRARAYMDNLRAAQQKPVVEEDVDAFIPAPISSATGE